MKTQPPTPPAPGSTAGDSGNPPIGVIAGIVILFALVLFLCSTACAQSFVISGGQRSMIISGSGPATQQTVTEVETKTRITPRKTVTKTETTITEPVYQDYVVVFTTVGCPPCQMMKQQTIPELRRRKVKVIEIDNVSVAAQYGVRSFPVVMVARKSQQRRRWAGFVSATEILKSIETPQQTAPRAESGFYDSTIYDGQPGSSHENRQSLIDHLVRWHAQIQAKLNGLSDAALNDLHNSFHPAQGEVQPTSRVTEPLLPRYITIAPYGRIDLATYSRTGSNGRPCQCGMCQAIYPHQRAYLEQQKRLKQQVKVDLDVGQQATPMELVKSGVSEMRLTASDFFVDIGCGDGRWLIAACEAGCCQAVGIEYDPELVKLARHRVNEAGLSEKIEIIEGDARNFDYSEATAIVVHLYDDLLNELKESGVFSNARVIVAPYHEIPDLKMLRRGNVWIYES